MILTTKSMTWKPGVALLLAAFATAPFAAGQCLSSETQELLASDASSGDAFGFAVALEVDMALVGSPADDDSGTGSGSVYVLGFDGTDWLEQQKLTASDAGEFQGFGSSAAVSGSVAVIGATFADGIAADTGAVYVFRFDGTNWVEE